MHPPGAIVRFRKRDWVVHPSEDPEVILLRPLAGTSEEAVGVHRQLSTLLGEKGFEEERIRLSSFPPGVSQSEVDFSFLPSMLRKSLFSFWETISKYYLTVW